MAYIYAYAPDAEDCSTIGLVGALLDENAEYELNEDEFGALTFDHPIDEYGKWKVLVNGAILKTMVPVRLCPGVKDDGTYVATVDVYKVATTATKAQRYIYSKKKNGKKKKLLKIGQKVTVTGVADATDPDSRYKVKLGKVSGWMERAGLTLEQQSLPVPQNESGIESVEPSYAVRQQLFRINSVQPSSQDDGKITVSALRIVYDLLGNVSTYKNTGSVSCLDVCQGILEETLVEHDFEIYSDIGDTHIWFDASDKNPIAALVDPEEGVCDRWEAEIVADDYEIYVLRKAGLDRGVHIEYARNMVGIDMTEDISTVISGVRPRGATKTGKPLYLDGHSVGGRDGYNYSNGTCANWLPTGYKFMRTEDGELIGTVIVRDTYDATSIPKINVLDVSDAQVEKGSGGVTTAVARRMMADEAVKAFKDDECDKPEITMDIDFVLLGDTEEYSQYKNLEPLFVYDTVHVVEPRLGIKRDVYLTSITWAIREERVAKSTFGELKNITPKTPAWQISGGISGNLILQGSITELHIQDGVVWADKLADKTITLEKIEDGLAANIEAGAAAGEVAAEAQQAAYQAQADVNSVIDKQPEGIYIADQNQAVTTKVLVAPEGFYVIDSDGTIAASLLARLQTLGTLKIRQTADGGHAFYNAAQEG